METPEKKQCSCDKNTLSLSHKTICDIGAMLIIVIVAGYALHRIISKHL